MLICQDDNEADKVIHAIVCYMWDMRDKITINRKGEYLEIIVTRDNPQLAAKQRDQAYDFGRGYLACLRDS